MRTIRMPLAVALGAAALLSLAACAGGATSASESPPPASDGPTTDSSASAFPSAPSGEPITAEGAAGVWGDASDQGAPSLTLAADGTLSGSDGCNLLTGRWEVDEGDSEIEFEELASTKMACEGVDTWLSGADRATISGDTMTVYADERVQIGTLERTG